MTTPIPGSVQVVATETSVGCAGCGTQDTVLLHPHHGRQCPDHITLPAGAYRPDLAIDMADLGRADAAFTYLRAYLGREIRDRFQASIDAVAVAW